MAEDIHIVRLLLHLIDFVQCLHQCQCFIMLLDISKVGVYVFII